MDTDTDHTELKCLLVQDKEEDAADHETRSGSQGDDSLGSGEFDVSPADVPSRNWQEAAYAPMQGVRQSIRTDAACSRVIGSKIPSIRQSYQYYKYIGVIPLSYILALGLACWIGLPEVAFSMVVAAFKKAGLTLRILFLISVCLASMKKAVALAFAIKRFREELVEEKLSSFRLKHYVVIPAYKEPVMVLARTLASLPRRTADSNKSVHVIMAMESKDSTHQETFEELQRMFESQFNSIEMTVHTLLPTERAGKGSNENFALRELRGQILEAGGDLWQTMVTVCDADSVFAPNYFNALESAYAGQLDGRSMIYSAPRNTYRNFGQLWNPIISATECTTNCSDVLRDLTEPYENYSNYSLLLGYADELDYWDAEIIPEDFHMVYKSMLCSHGKSSVCRVWSLISNDTVIGFRDRYVQAKRHNWGVTNIAWIVAICRHAPFSVDRVWFKMLTTYFSEMAENLCPSSITFVLICCYLVRFVYQSHDPVIPEAMHFLLLSACLGLVLNWLVFFAGEFFIWTQLLTRMGDAVQWPSRGQMLWLYGMTPLVGPLASLIFGNVACMDALASASWSSEFEYVCAPKA
eukprot:TRINITY_DN1995_c0_g1_i1.p1 TRINITY_DN1995_c0_g1~~TRINITY_DN1995_c0_g1_i1.p1  ORF type:complete len:580 (-),score=73.34 TRINITY_DN1995_c0_g1_i1:106-1845(-)